MIDILAEININNCNTYQYTYWHEPVSYTHLDVYKRQAERVRNAFLGMGDDCHLLLQTFDEYLAGFLKRVGKDRAYSSYKDYCKRRRLASFLEYEYHVRDIAFKELKRDFIEKFVAYLSSEQGMRSGTIHSTVKKLKLMTYTAYKNGWIASNPFAGFYVKAEYSEPVSYTHLDVYKRQGENYTGDRMGYFDVPGWPYERFFFEEFVPACLLYTSRCV